MLNKSSLMLAAAFVALGASNASADPYDHSRSDRNPNMQSNSEQATYANGYNNGYEDGMARHQRNDRYQSTRYLPPAPSQYQRGAYYYGNDCSSSAATGTVVGAVAGGVIGNQFGHGDGRTAATVGGVILGGIAGNAIASDMNCNDRRQAFLSYSSGFEGRIGSRYDWRGAERGNYGHFTPVREYARGGNTCRDFTSVSYSNGHRYTRSGTACRQTDGNWYLQ
jgi:surface antigen